jgi:hypothetical protein
MVAACWGCQTAAVPGTPCTRDGDCAAPLACRLGRCRTQCGENRDCPLGAQCFLDQAGLGACQLELDHSCSGGCPSGLSCLSDQCVRACTGPSDCPEDGFCAIPSGATVGLCVDLRPTDGGAPDVGPGPLDVGPTDGGPIDVGLDAQGPDVGPLDAGTSPIIAASVCAGTRIVCAVRATDGAVFCAGDAGSAGATRIADGSLTTTPTYPHCAFSGLDGPSASPPRQANVLAPSGSATVPLVGATEIACGDGAVCAIVAGEVYCWGANYARQRADTTLADRPYATPTGVMADHVYAGRNHFCALRGGELTCWGENGHSETGLPASASSSGPHVVASGVIQAATGSDVTCWATSAASVECVGWNHSGQLGVDPMTVPTSDVARSIAVDGSAGLAAAGSTVCALDATGIVRCWGAGDHGMFGDGTTTPMATTPVPVVGAARYEALFGGARGDDFCARRRASGTVECWGDNNHARLLSDPTVTSSVVITPTHLAALDGATMVSIGDGTGIAQLAGGSARVWGSNALGELGTGACDADTHASAVPFSIP